MPTRKSYPTDLTDVRWNLSKKVKGRKRHLLVDTLGLLLVWMTTADVQDRDAASASRW
nr:hypothetical protein [Archangium sp.]